jgi:amino acid transporter
VTYTDFVLALSPFDAGTFVDAYILLPLFGIIYAGYKFWFKTRFWRSHEIDLDAGMRKDLDAKEEPVDGETGVGSQKKQGFVKRMWTNF